MPLFAKTETTGQDLLAQYSSAAEAFQAEADRIAEEAADRETVIEARLKELEAEKLIVAQLADPPKVLVARAGRDITQGPPFVPDSLDEPRP